MSSVAGSRRSLRWPSIWSAVAGLVAAAAYALSPMTVLAGGLAVLLLRAAGRGLPAGERRWLAAVLLLALAVRVAAVGAIFLAAPHDDQALAVLSGDEAQMQSRAMRMRDIIRGTAVDRYDYTVVFDEYGQNSYNTVLAAAQVIFGPSPYAMRLVNAVLFLCAAVLLFRVARGAFGALPAFGGLLVLLFVPTLLVWSISLLKESLYFFLTSTAVVAALAAMRARDVLGALHTNAGPPEGGHHEHAEEGRTDTSYVASTFRRTTAASAFMPTIGVRVGALAVLAGVLWALRDLRPGALAFTAAGLVLGAAAAAFTTRDVWTRVIAAASIVVFACVALALPSIRSRLLSGIGAAARTHAGNVFTVGHSYKLLDEAFYVHPRPLSENVTLTVDEAARFLIRAVASIIAVPLPWQLATRSELLFMPEQLLWYAIVILAIAGARHAFQADSLVAGVLTGVACTTAAVIAVTNGNVGTLIRFRGLVTPYLIWIAAIGFCVMMRRLALMSHHARFARQSIDTAEHRAQ